MNLQNEKSVLDFERAARSYCSLLEVDPVDEKEWITSMLAALAMIYAAAHLLPVFDLPDDVEELPDTFNVSKEESVIIRTRIQNILGAKSKYQAYFNPTIINDPSEEPVIGELWDDLGDIYQDIKPGLNAWDANRTAYLQNIASDWRWPLFEVHWGHHAVDAMRALHQLAFNSDTES